MISLCHFFAVLFYGISHLEGQNSWALKYGLTTLPFIQKYVISFYFALTTMVTVGYGDFTPQTYLEMIFVIC